MGIKLLKFSNLDLNKDIFQEIHQNSKNIIYYNSARKTYYKVYKTAVKSDMSKFLFDLFHQEQFHEQFCPSLLALIMTDDDLIKGYVTKKGYVLSTNELNRYLTNPRVQQVWKKSMLKYGFYYVDIKPRNLIQLKKSNTVDENTVTVIDLESFKPLEPLKTEHFDVNSDNVKAKLRLFNLDWYYKFIDDYQKKAKQKTIKKDSTKDSKKV